jgi:hypothetical protein
MARGSKLMLCRADEEDGKCELLHVRAGAPDGGAKAESLCVRFVRLVAKKAAPAGTGVKSETGKARIK